MVGIPLPLSTFPGERQQEGAGRLINARAEPIGEGGRAEAVRHRVPGLATFAATGGETFRGSLLNGSTLYVAFSSFVRKIASDGTVSAVDALNGDDRVFFARNNKRPTPDVLLVCGEGIFTLASDVIADLGDGDVPSPTDVCFLDGYFFVGIADGRCFASGLNAITFNSNDFITAEAKSDTLYRVIPWNGQLLICSSGSIEVWSGQPVNVTGFPFNRVAVIQRGIAGQGAISGFEEGFGKGLLFVGDDNAVHWMNGYSPEKVSPPDLDRLIEAVSDKNTLDASVYISGGHPIWVLSSEDWTWEFDLNTKKWNERKSYELSRWRGVRSFYAYGKWFCGDTQSGDILEISRTTYDEAGEPLVAEVWSAPVHKFPNRIRCARADFDFSPGVGIATGSDPNETDPSVEISYSDDGGFSFGTPRIRKLGRQAKAQTRVTLFNNGMSSAQGRIWKIRMSDARHFGLMAGDMSAELRSG